MPTRAGRRRLLGILFVILAACLSGEVSVRAAGEYRTVEVESLKITIDSQWAAQGTPGYVPIRFDITNLGEARVIDIVGQGSRWFLGRRSGSAGFGGIVIRQAVRLARGDRVRLTIPLPVFADNDNIRFEIQEDGRTLQQFNSAGYQSRGLPSASSALIVADTNNPFGKVAATWPRGVTAPARGSRIAAGAGGKMPSLDFLLDATRLPTNWLGFTSLRAVIIGPTEWSQLNEAQKGALLTWTACGGDLIFVDGDISALFPGGQNPPEVKPDPATGRAAGGYFFGRIHLTTSAAIETDGLANVLTAAEMLQDANFALPANRAADWGVIAARGFRLPIPGVDGVPARAYLLILIVFSILIGPANYWFLKRKRQQVLLVLTTPIISGLFIVVLAGYVVAGEGLGVRGRAVSFTMLDEVRKQAVTRASVSLYAAGMTPAGGLNYPRDTAVIAIGHDGTGSYDQQALDLTDAQRFTAGVLRARSPANLEQVGFRPARERLTFSRDAGGIGVTNGLGATVAALLYRDGGKIYRLAGPLLPGGKGVLTAFAGDARDLVPAGLPQTTRFEFIFQHPPEGAYLAVLETSPFWEPGVTGLVERGSFHLVLGWPGGQQ